MTDKQRQTGKKRDKENHRLIYRQSVRQADRHTNRDRRRKISTEIKAE